MLKYKLNVHSLTKNEYILSMYTYGLTVWLRGEAVFYGIWCLFIWCLFICDEWQ